MSDSNKGLIQRFLSIFSSNKEENELINKINELEEKLNSVSKFSQENLNNSHKDTDETNILPALIEFITTLKEHAEKGKKNDIGEELFLFGKKTISDEYLYHELKNNPLQRVFIELFKDVYDIRDLNSISSDIGKKKILNNLAQSFESIIPYYANKATVYKSMHNLYKSFPIARRIVKEYVRSILQEDPVSGEIFHYKENIEIKKYINDIYYKEIVDEIKRIYKIIEKHLDIYNLLRNKIIPKAAVKGDVYIEVINKKKFLLDNFATIKNVFSYSTSHSNSARKLISPELVFESEVINSVNNELINETSYSVNKITALITKYKRNEINKYQLFDNLLEETLNLVSKELLELEISNPILNNSSYMNETQIDEYYDDYEQKYETVVQELENIESVGKEINNNFEALLIEGAGREKKNNRNRKTIEDQIESYLNYLRLFSHKELSQKIELKIYDPEYVIPISDGYKIYGYLVINPYYKTDSDNNDYESISATDSIIEKLGKIFDKINTLHLDFEKVSKKMYSKLLDYFYKNLNSVLNKYIEKIEKSLNDLNGLTTPEIEYYERYKKILNKIFELINIDEKFKYQFFNVLQDVIFEQKLSKIRFRILLPNELIHFYLYMDEYPYGESILSPVALHSTLYLVSVYSNIMYRLTRTPLYTKYQINAGALQNWESEVRQIASKLRGASLTIDDLGRLEKINRYLTDFKFMFEVLKDGQPILSQTMERLGDPNVRVQDIQDFKQDIAMLSNIPSMRLGFMDGAEIREKIVDANIQWSEMITDIQKNIELSINKLFDKIIFETIEPKTTYIPTYNFVKVRMIRPIILNLLQLQNIVGTAGAIISTLTQIPNLANTLDIVKLLKELVPSVKWDELLKSDNPKEAEFDKLLNINKQQQEQSGGGGLSGGF